jgi:hypothetical protein
VPVGSAARAGIKRPTHHLGQGRSVLGTLVSADALKRAVRPTPATHACACNSQKEGELHSIAYRCKYGIPGV